MSNSSIIVSSNNSSEVADKTLGNEFENTIIINFNNNNKYIIIYKLGCGTFSSVWLSYSLYINQLVALKIYHPREKEESLRESLIYEKINNSNIDKEYILTSIEIFEIEPIIDNINYYNNDKSINKHHIIVLPLMAISTYDLLDYYDNGIEYDIILTVCKQLILGLIEFEKLNLCHTDLKPENILMCGITYKMEYIENFIKNLNLNINMDDEILNNNIILIKNKLNEYTDGKCDMIIDKYFDNIKIKICDFNLSVDYENLCNYKDFQTRYYRAPEIIMGYNLNKVSDYWSIPCILFELLTGNILFNPEKKNNLINVKNKIKYWKLKDIIKKYKLKKSKELVLILKIINIMLVIEPTKRISLKYILDNYLN